MNKYKIKFVDFSSDSVPANIRHALDLANIEYEISEEPEYIFCSVFGHEALNYDCIRIFWTGENCVPDFNLYDYAIGFHYIDFGDRYLRLPLFYFYNSDYKEALKKHEMDVDEIWERKGVCNFVYSNSDAAIERQEFYDLLSQKMKVDSGGRYLNNIGGPVNDKMEFLKKYRFTIAFENSSSPGYTTEKILQAFAAGSIPIYWGDYKIAEHFNEKSFVNCHSYNSFEQVVGQIERINQDKKLFESYIREPIWNNACKKEFPKDPMTLLAPFLSNIFTVEESNHIYRNRGSWGRIYEARQKGENLDVADEKKKLYSIVRRIMGI